MESRSVMLLARSKRRRSARGAALVEGVIVSSLLMTLMAGGLFLHHLYLAQIKAIERARLAAWSQALHGCNSSVDLAGIWRDAGESSAPMDVDTESTPSFFGAVGHESGRASETATAHARAGGKSYTQRIEDSVACNEIAQDARGDVLSLVGYITANVIPSFF